jgi:hypothetical protein
VHEAGPAVLGDEREFRVGHHRTDGNRDRTPPPQRQDRHHGRDGVVGDDQPTRSGLDPGLGQPRRIAPHRPVQLRVAEPPARVQVRDPLTPAERELPAYQPLDEVGAVHDETSVMAVFPDGSIASTSMFVGAGALAQYATAQATAMKPPAAP